MLSKSKALVTYSLIAASFTIMPLKDAFAGPGTLPRAPLFLSSVVEPNIFFTLDDSGSMDWGPMIKNGTGGFYASGGLPTIDGYQRGYYVPEINNQWEYLYSSRRMLPPSNTGDPVWDLTWMFRTHHGNGSYYNPDTKYVPWPGSDVNGDPLYKDADPAAVIEDPDDASTSGRYNLTVRHSYSEYISGFGTISTNNMWIPTYYTWTDTDGDGVIEDSDEHTLVEIATGTPEMQNFANWFQYYRSRINATKSIIGNVMNNTDAARMGYRLFNAGQQYNAVSMSDPANKRAVLNKMYEKNIGRYGTPARNSLKYTGEYFRQSSGGPIFNAANGGECQQNFNILMSDGFWNGYTPSNIGNRDKNGSSGNTKYDGNASQSNDGGNYADDYSNTLADVAMRYYESDLRTDLGNKVPTQTGIDEADHQHLVTYTIAFGLNGTLDPATDDPLAAGFSWPKPVANTETTVDDMWHAAYNGRGLYLSAQNPAELTVALSTAIQDISERTGTAAAVAINSARLSTESVIYLAQFNSNRWQGDLIALQIEDATTGRLADTPKWQAGPLLTARDVDANPRTIISYSNDSNDGVPFQWANLSVDMQNDLKTNPSGGTDSATVGEARLDYLRGSRDDEGQGYFFRERLSLLGDLVNSGPVFVGGPDLNWPDFAPFPEGAAAYSVFKNGASKSRKEVVYAGANDGMLHAYDADSGQEVLAYVPGFFTSSVQADGLHYLTDPNYVHKFYVDLTPSISDVYIATSGVDKWRTILVNGVRDGGRGVFALDVTDPDGFGESDAANIVLWEFTDQDDIDLGYTYSRPFIGLANNGRWVAIFGNGYNDNGSGEASLFVVDIEKGIDGSWDIGDYVKLSTGVGDSANRNGLATPALADLDGNGTIDRVYAGDLNGNMWSFDLSDTNSGAWGSAYKDGSNNPDPLFTTNNGRPITTRPVLAKHPTQPDSFSSPSNQPNVMVFFGSGQYLVNADKTSTNQESFYGVWDKGDKNLTASTNLVKQTQDADFSSGFVLTRNNVDYATKHGWYFDLPDSGERSITFPIARGDIIFFNSYVPLDDPCSTGGFGYPYAIDMTIGGSATRAVFDANNDNSITKDGDTRTSDDGTSSRSDARGPRREGVAIGDAFLEDRKFTGSESTLVESLPYLPTGRFSWQELIQ